MDTLSRAQLRTLLNDHAFPCVSIYQATAKIGRERQRGPVALKNRVRIAEEQLVATGMRKPEARALLKPAQDVVDDAPFWRQQGDGLAVFRSPDLFAADRLPLTFDDFIFVGRRFHITPLVPLLADNSRLFILGISEQEVRLLEATKYDFRTVELPAGTPQTMLEATPFDVPDKQRQFHTVTAAGTKGRGHPIYHGQGMGTHDDKDRRQRFFRVINHALRPRLREETAPLVLAAAPYYLPLYREVNTYPHLVDEVIPGTPQLRSDGELHEHGWKIVEPLFDHERERAIVQYRNLMGTGRASDQLAEIVLAANDGRVNYLFAQQRTHVWGTFDAPARQVEIHGGARPGDEDLLDRAVHDALRNRGTVYVVDKARMPDRVVAAATVRY